MLIREFRLETPRIALKDMMSFFFSFRRMRSSRSRYIGSHSVSFFDDQVQRCEQRSSKLEGYTFCATPSASSFRQIFFGNTYDSFDELIQNDA